jgi:hypothetical protein
MRIKNLLANVALCTTDEEIKSVMAEVLIPSFQRTAALRHLLPTNEDYGMEGSNPYLRFELNHVISDHYITMIRPEIRDKKFVVSVVTNHMLDGAGMSSQKWEAEESMDDLIEPDENMTIAAVAKHAKVQALAHHRELIERLGVPRKVAETTVKKSW